MCIPPQAKLAQIQQLQADLAESERARAGLQAQVDTLSRVLSGCPGPGNKNHADAGADAHVLELRGEVQVHLARGPDPHIGLIRSQLPFKPEFTCRRTPGMLTLRRVPRMVCDSALGYLPGSVAEEITQLVWRNSAAKPRLGSTLGPALPMLHAVHCHSLVDCVKRWQPTGATVACCRPLSTAWAL